MGKFTKMEFNPEGGLTNSAYSTTPASEAEARADVQDVSDQLKNRINGLVDELENAETGTSGAERIGSAEILGLPGKITVRDQIAELKTQMEDVQAGVLTPNSVDNAKLAEDVKVGSLEGLTTGEKGSVQGAINELDAEIGDISTLTTNTNTSLVAAINELDGESVNTDKLVDGAVTETKIGAGAVTSAKLNASVISDSVSLNDGSICASAKAVYTLNNTKQANVTGGASTITASNLTANRVLISNSSGKVAVSGTITSTELGYLNGVTCGIQTQLNAKQATLPTEQKRKISITNYTPSNSVGDNYDIWIKYS